MHPRNPNTTHTRQSIRTSELSTLTERRHVVQERSIQQVHVPSGLHPKGEANDYNVGFVFAPLVSVDF